MNNFVFWSPTKFVFGRDTESRTGALAREFGGRKVLLVYGGGSVVRSGLLDRVKASLSASGIEWEEMGGIQPNPTDDRVYEGIELVRSRNIDMLIAVGVVRSSTQPRASHAEFPTKATSGTSIAAKR